MDQTIELILQGANTVSVVGICTLIIVLFLRGDIIAKVVHDRVLALYEKQMNVALGLLSEKLGEVVTKSMTVFTEKIDETMRRWEDRQRQRDDEYYRMLREKGTTK